MVRKILATLIGATLLASAFVGFDLGWLRLDEKVAFKVGRQNPIVSNVVQARPLSLVCPGPAFLESSKSGVAAKFHQVGSSETGVNRSAVASFETSSAASTVTTGADQLNSQQGSDLLSANQTQVLHTAPNGASAGANGLISTECQLPSSDFWFLGADTSVGRQALLVVKNASRVNATFDLELFDEGGAIQAAGMLGLSVAAGDTLVTPLAAFAPSNRALAAHVSSRGGAVVAWVQQKTVRGTVAAGIDFISPLSPADQQQVIPGLSVYGAKAATAIKKLNPDYEDLAPVVRVFAPRGGKEPTKTVEVTVLVSGIDAKTFGTVVRQTIKVGQTSDIAISGLADGRYSAIVTADTPLFASLKLSRTSVDQARVLTSLGSDFTWIPAGEQISSGRTIVAPTLGTTTLNLRNASPQATTVTTVVGGVAKEYQLSENGLMAIIVRAGSVVQISATSPIYANLMTIEDAGISNLRVLDQKNLGGEVSVELR